jgi:phenylacetate-coenzyme A ligase PaaK-like adenylate-forming protein
VRTHADVDEFQVVFRRVDGLDDILVRVDPAPALPPAGREHLERAVAESLRMGLGIRVSVEITEPGGLPRWDHKARRVRDERTEVPF